MKTSPTFEASILWTSPTGATVTYCPWDYGQPNDLNGDEYCCESYKNAMGNPVINDYACAYQLPTFCQYCPTRKTSYIKFLDLTSSTIISMFFSCLAEFGSCLLYADDHLDIHHIDDLNIDFDDNLNADDEHDKHTNNDDHVNEHDNPNDNHIDDNDEHFSDDEHEHNDYKHDDQYEHTTDDQYKHDNDEHVGHDDHGDDDNPLAKLREEVRHADSGDAKRSHMVVAAPRLHPPGIRVDLNHTVCGELI